MSKRISNQMRNNRKGQAEYLLENAFRIGFLMIALLAFFLLITYYINNKADTRLLQAETFANRIVYSDAIMYQDEKTFRIYPGIVDLAKVNDTRLDKSISYSATRHAAAKIKIVSKPQQDGTAIFIKDAYINRNTFENLYNMITARIYGKGSGIQVIKEFPVTCYDTTSTPPYYYCTLIVEVIVPNS
ncbi:MAG: hypothetical protein WC916_07120 [Candidatus Woesearchaeota archaeon]